MTLYKLTDKNGYTNSGGYNYIRKKVHRKKPCKNPQLGTIDVFHAYKDANLGLLLNPMNSGFTNPRLFEIEGDVVVENWEKVGCFRQNVLRELPLPDWYVNRRLEVGEKFAELCAAAAGYTATDAGYAAAANRAVHYAADDRIDFVALAKQAIEETENAGN